MTRRDYVLIAAAIKNQVDRYRTTFQTEAIGALSELSLSLCDDLQANNAAFDRARFLAACGF